MKIEIRMEHALKEASREEPEITKELIGKLIKENNFDVCPKRLKKGIEIEMEHWDTAGGDINIIANIANDHLKEDEDYYEKLDEMEKEVDTEDTEKTENNE